MDDAQGEAAFAGAVLDLEEAAGIAGGDGVGAGDCDVIEFTIEKLGGHFRLNDVIDAGAAAAPFAFSEFDEFEFGNRFQDGAWLRGDFLAVTEMAGFVVGDGLFAQTFR